MAHDLNAGGLIQQEGTATPRSSELFSEMQVRRFSTSLFSLTNTTTLCESLANGNFVPHHWQV